MQLDEKERGFSFQGDGPLDMRMDPTSDVTAEDIVNTWSEEKLAKAFKEYGEEPRWKKAARAIVSSRRKKRIKTTKDLTDVILSDVGGRRGRLHPATLIFQALRICVNEELKSVEEAVRKAITLLAPKGRIGVISFHSLEDRIVKHVFKAASAPLKRVRDSMEEGEYPMLNLLTKKPVVPTLAEKRRNRRARSAKFRVAEKKSNELVTK